MTASEAKRLVLSALGDIAPEAEPQTLASDEPLRDQVELDSFDFLNFVAALSAGCGRDIPESDYAELATIDSAVEYLSDA